VSMQPNPIRMVLDLLRMPTRYAQAMSGTAVRHIHQRKGSKWSALPHSSLVLLGTVMANM
jgi:hypothetical protein